MGDIKPLTDKEIANISSEHQQMTGSTAYCTCSNRCNECNVFWPTCEAARLLTTIAERDARIAELEKLAPLKQVPCPRIHPMDENRYLTPLRLAESALADVVKMRKFVPEVTALDAEAALSAVREALK